MKKRFIVAVVTLLVVALVAPAAFAAITDQQQEEINKIYQQMFDLRKQVIDKYVEGGEITPEQAEALKDNVDYMQQHHNGYGFGWGMMGAGHYGGGFYGTQSAPSGYRSGWGMMGGYGMMY